jgi:uncharacterized lipoprotein YmbA
VTRRPLALRRAYLTWLGVVVLASSGCGVIRRAIIGGDKEPTRYYYGLRLPDAGDSAVVAAGTNGVSMQGSLVGTLAVLPYITAGLYGEPRLVFRTGETEYNTYPNREWAIPLSQQLGMMTESVLRRTPLTSEPALFDPPSRSSYTYVWRGAVRHFEEVARGADVVAEVHVVASLVRTTDDSVLWTGGARLERNLGSTKDNNVIVTAMSELAAEAITRMIREADAAVRRRPAVGARSGR